MLLERLLPIQYRRTRLLARALPGPLHDFLSVAFPSPGADYRDVNFLAVDLETTGLDCKQDHILSIGMVDINRDGINLGSAKHVIVHTKRELPAETVVIHKLTDDVVADGLPFNDAICLLLENMRGKVLLAHHARIEFGFIRHACQVLFDGEWLAPVVDTQQLAIQRLGRQSIPAVPARLRLDSLRQQYRLAPYQAHNALADAIATAELFLAEVAEISGINSGILLKRLLSTY